jgi:hypothetical protein
MSWPLYALLDLAGADSPKWRRWARAVKKHQHQLASEMAPHLGAPAHEADPVNLPWTLEDLIRRKKPYANQTSRYYGVKRTPPTQDKQGWLGYAPRNARAGRRGLGWFPTELEAAYAVLHFMNPAAAPPAQEVNP